MKQDLIRMKLYLYMQKFKELIQSPYLEALCEKGMSEVSFLEEELITKKAGLFAYDREGCLMNLLEEKYLYQSDHSSAFLSKNDIVLLKPPISSDHNKESQAEADMIVSVISNEDDVKNVVREMEYTGHTGGHPLRIFLFDSDREMGMAKCRENIAACLNSIGYRSSQPDEITYIAYSLSKAIQAQKMIDNQLMLESNFFAVKKELQKAARLALRKQLLTSCLSPFVSLLDTCKAEIDCVVDGHRAELVRLQKIKQGLEEISPGFPDAIGRKCMEACRVSLEAIKFEINPGDTTSAENIVNRVVNEKIQSVFEPQANEAIADAFHMMENGWTQYFSQFTETPIWMKSEDKILFMEKLSLLKIDQKTFRFPEFRIDMIGSVSSTMGLSEVNQQISYSLQTALTRYHAELKNMVTVWLMDREKQYSSKIGELIQMLKDSIAAAIEEHDQHINAILASDTSGLLENMISEVNNLESDCCDQTKTNDN